MEVDTTPVLRALEESRTPEARATVREAFLGHCERALIWIPWPVTHKMTLWVTTAASLGGAAVLAPLQDKATWWLIAVAIAWLHLLLASLVEWANKHRASSAQQGEIALIRNNIEHALSVVKDHIGKTSDFRITILLPSDVRDGALTLVPALRSDGIPVSGSRRSRVIKNKHDKCEGVCGIAFVRDMTVQRAAWPSDATYGDVMMVDKSFIASAADSPNCCRHATFVVAFPLRYRDRRCGVLAVDSATSLNLLVEGGHDTHCDSLTGAKLTRHQASLSALEAVAQIIPRVALSRLFSLCGVEV